MCVSYHLLIHSDDLQGSCTYQYKAEPWTGLGIVFIWGCCERKRKKNAGCDVVRAEEHFMQALVTILVLYGTDLFTCLIHPSTITTHILVALSWHTCCSYYLILAWIIGHAKCIHAIAATREKKSANMHFPRFLLLMAIGPFHFSEWFSWSW